MVSKLAYLRVGWSKDATGLRVALRISFYFCTAAS